MSTKLYQVPIEYSMSGTIRVLANSIEEACDIIENRKGEIPINLYKDDEYIEDSYSVNREAALDAYKNDSRLTAEIMPSGTILGIDTRRLF